tara:strand:+ start:111 stop:425 length:315 start_codon:yes stop_codon:yes gene_type:complete
MTAAAPTSAREEEIKETDLSAKEEKIKRQIERAEALQESDESNSKVELLKTELKLEGERRTRDEKGQAEAAANLARRMQREKDLQIKEARRLHPTPPHRCLNLI